MSGDGPYSGWASLFWIAFERSANPMGVAQTDRVIVAVNEACVNAFGYDRREVIGRRTDFFVAPEWRRQVEQDWNALLRTGEATLERDVVRADGSHLRVQFAAHRELVTRQQLILFVALDSSTRPLTHRGEGESEAKPLTARELEIVGEIAMGRRRHEIADDLFIAESTVKTHVHNAMGKLGARSQAQLVAIALAHGILDPERVERELSK